MVGTAGSADLDIASFQPAPVTRPRQQVESQLRSAILSGVFGRGERFPSEAKLAAQFKVSRATVREALRALVEAGLVSTVPGAGGGSFVRYFDHHKLRDLMSERLHSTLEFGSITYDEVATFRRLLEVPSAQLAAQNRTQFHLGALEALVGEERRTTVDDPRVPGFNAEFHGLVAEASGNRLLSAFVGALHRAAQPLAFIDISPEVGRQTVRHHIGILAAISAQDPDRATLAMNTHLDYLHEHVAGSADAQAS
jgi:DNA-binding FadR family transcriptional regulator